MRDLEEHFTYLDAVHAHEVLDTLDIAEERARAEAEREAQRRRGRR